MAKVSSGQRVLAELSADPVALRNKHTAITGQIDALERRLDYLEGRLENAQKTGNQTVYNAVLKQYQDMANRVQSLATEANSIGDSIRYQADYTNRQQKITDSKPKTTMDKVRESLPYALGSGIRDMVVDAGKGLGQTALYADNQLRTGKAGTQGSVMNPEDFTINDVGGEYATALGSNTGSYLDALNSVRHWIGNREIGSKPDSEDEKYAKMFGGGVRDFVDTKPLEDQTVMEGAKLLVDPLFVGSRAKAGIDAVTDPKLWQGIARDMSMGTRSNAIDVWHGSPHEFDEFKANANLGKGEGAQAYGVGGYTAGSKDIAEYYKNSVKADVRDLGFVDGSGNEVLPKDNNMAWEMIDLADGDLNKAREKLASLYSRNPEDQRYISSLAELDGLIESGVKANAPRQQNLYKIRLAWNDAQKEKAMPLSGDHFLDLDRYMDQQSPYVLDKLKEGGYTLQPDREEVGRMVDEKISQDADEWAERTGGDPLDFINSKWGVYFDAMEKDLDGISRFKTGRQFYNGLVSDFGYNSSLFEGKDDYARAVSDFLYEKGIAGNKFEDANLRMGEDGDYNYVNFSDDLATVLERNGVPIKKAKK